MLERKNIKDIAEAIGFGAIILSLYLVAVETREATEQTRLNTQALEIAAYHSLIDSISDMNKLVVESEEAAGVVLAMRSVDELHIDEYRVSSAYFNYFRHGDIAYYMYERGVISEERLASALKPLPLYSDAGRAQWQRVKTVFVDGYQDYVDNKIADGFWDRSTLGPNAQPER